MASTRAESARKIRKPAKAGAATRRSAGESQPGQHENVTTPLGAPARPARPAAASGPTLYMTSTEAQNGFGRVLDTVARNGTVLITRRNSTQAVVMSMERYKELTRGEVLSLDVLAAEYEDLLAHLRTPAAREGALRALRSTPEELAQAAVAAARKRKEQR